MAYHSRIILVQTQVSWSNMCVERHWCNRIYYWIYVCNVIPDKAFELDCCTQYRLLLLSIDYFQELKFRYEDFPWISNGSCARELHYTLALKKINVDIEGKILVFRNSNDLAVIQSSPCRAITFKNIHNYVSSSTEYNT